MSGRSSKGVEGETTLGNCLAHRVLLVGWDAADWAFLRPLMDAGHMPTLSRFVEAGHCGNIATLQPMLSPMLWTSIATGKTADHHGIHGFTEPTPDGAGVRPVASTSRTCKALWNILSQRGLKSNVVGWYATQPAEPILGTIVADRFEQPASPLPPRLLADAPPHHPVAAWPVPPGSVHPPQQAEALADLRVHPTEIDAAAILPFIPEAQWIAEHGTDLQKAKLHEFRGLLAQTASIHAITTALMAYDDWDLTAVYYEGIDRFAHAFMAYHPPQLPEIDDRDFQLFRHVMTGIYRFHDMMLDTLLKIAGPDTAVILLSDHGYHHSEKRPGPDGKVNPVGWHRPFGVVALGGAGFASTTLGGNRLYGASLLDAAPTVLRLLGLPVGADMPGRPWVEAFERPVEADRILSWEHHSGPHPDGRHPPDAIPDPAVESAALQHLIDLGYVDPPGPDAQQNVEDTRAHNAINLADALTSIGKHAEALAQHDTLPPRIADDESVRFKIAFAALGAGQPDRAGTEAQRLLDRAAERNEPPPPRAHVLLGTLALAEQRLDDAERHFADLKYPRAGSDPELTPGILNRLGTIYFQTKRFADARVVFERALADEPESVLALEGLARLALRDADPAAALDYALQAVGLIHHFPRGHLRVGQALARLADLAERDDADTHTAVQSAKSLGSPSELRQRAAQAVELCLTQSSRFREAHETLAGLYRKLGRTTDAVVQDALALRSKADAGNV